MIRRVFVAVVAAAAVIVAVVVTTSGDDKYVVYAQLSDAAGILNNYNVKVGQVPAGKVTDITLDSGDHAILKLELDKDAAPIGQGATAKVRPVNILGEKYVDLDPGDLQHPLPSASTIPLSRTGVPVELDDVLNVLAPDTRGALRILINEAGVTMAGRGADFNQLLGDLPPALDAAKQVVGEVAADNARLKSMVTQGDRVIDAISVRRDGLVRLVQSAGAALQTVAERRAQLGETVQNAPEALDQLRGTLTRLEQASLQLQPAADEIRATSPSLAETLARLPAFARDADGVLEEATRVSPLLSRLGRESTPTLRTLQPTARHLASFAGDIQPLVDTLDQQGGLKGLEGFIAGWAGVTGTRDGIGHVFRLSPTIDQRLLTSILERYVNGELPPPPGRGKRDGSGSRPAGHRAHQPPAGEAPPSSLPPSLDELGTLADRLGNGVDGLTGRTPPGAGGDPSVGRVINYLLGQ
jgi:phospholipid/cholesterol/gamma-HCH transport system substrate-binding protein